MRRGGWFALIVMLLVACSQGASAPTATIAPPTTTATAPPSTATIAAAPPTQVSPAVPPATTTATAPRAATPGATPVAARTITFTTEDGATLGGTIYGSSASGSWVILSNNGDGRQANWQPLVDALVARGYAVLTYDWRGLGASSGSTQNWMLAPRDTQAAIGAARANGAQRLILGGGSLGGITSVKQAGSPGVAGIVVVSSPTNVAPLTISAQEMAGIAVPKLFVASKQDQVVPVAQTQLLYDYAPQPKALQIYDGSAHGTNLLTSGDRDHVIGLIADFVAATFAGARAPLAARAQDDAATARWREDLRALTNAIRTIHPKPFWRGNERDFQAEVDQLDRAIPYLDDNAIKVGLIQLTAMIDGHTILPFSQGPMGFGYYPLRLYSFSDGIFVIDAQPPWQDVIGARLVQIGDLSADEAFRRLAPLAQHDNDLTLRLLTPVHMLVPEELIATGVIADPTRPNFVFELRDETRRTLNPPPTTTDLFRAWGGGFAPLPQQGGALYLSRTGERFWFTPLEESRSLYIQYNQVQSSTQSGESLTTMASKIERALADHDVARVIVDLRHNSGGDNHTYGPLLRLLQSAAVNQPGRLFVITSRHTFSAAANFATEVERTTHAIFVGEPMGGRPNLYGDTRTATLPNSHLTVYVSALYWQKSTPDDTRPWIEPQLPALLSSTDYFAGRDPALAAILGG
jgi:pimeloyl-ACP methyl ester carboxylesterase